MPEFPRIRLVGNWVKKEPERIEDTLRPAARPAGIEATIKLAQLGSGPAAYVS
jgi:hypothetical protein